MYNATRMYLRRSIILVFRTGNAIRQEFLHFFADQGHLILPSYPLIPENDPTLLLIGAGMAPFKPFFTGKMQPPRRRIATSQRCVRTGDIENVGRTARHHTFFEMLGNFSFGDYFKQEAITWAWEFLTKHLDLPAARLWITIHTEDDEAYDIWHRGIGIPDSRIVRLKDNFWEIGPGPCGPCSEIHIDQGADRGCGQPTCGVECDCDRFLEIWNLVFTQFERDEEGHYQPLAQKNIDTGMGLERLAAVLQGKSSNFETDLLFPIIARAADIAGVTYGVSRRTDVSLKVIGDHARSVTVMVADGVLPANEGRGYVLRRILRRAVRHGRLLDIDRPFLTEMADVAADIYAEPYPYIREQLPFIKRVIAMEENRFNTTLQQGMEMLEQQLQVLKGQGGNVLPGDVAFRLYDTYGFPKELTAEILAEQGLRLDETTFARAMQQQRERARLARQSLDTRVRIPDLSGLVTGGKQFDPHVQQARVVLLLQHGQVSEAVQDDQDAAVILDVTPFHPEGGGQLADQGVLFSAAVRAHVHDVRKQPDGTIYHVVHIDEGELRCGEVVQLTVDEARRRDIARNHTATHLLHQALRDVLGSHVKQAGSLVAPDHLRFDFSHLAALTPLELQQVEDKVNAVIWDNLPVVITQTTLEQAKEAGAMALFGEKYGEQVRLVSIGDYSKELCGGTHLGSTAPIGLFKIVAESSTGAGVRRIEAVTGRYALARLREMETTLATAAATLKTNWEELPAKVDAVLEEIKTLQKELADAGATLAQGTVTKLLAGRRQIDGVSVVADQVQVADMAALRNMADMVRDRLQSGVVALAAPHEGKVSFVVMTSGDLTKRGVHAGVIVREMAAVAGGSGGGRPDMAQAGGKQPEHVAAALAKAVDVVQKQLRRS